MEHWDADTFNRDPLSLLRELLEEDRRNGLGWDELCFPQVVDVVCRATGGQSWFEPLVETADVWRAAYDRMPAGALEQFGAHIADDESNDRPGVAFLG